MQLWQWCSVFISILLLLLKHIIIVTSGGKLLLCEERRKGRKLVRMTDDWYMDDR